MPNKKCAACGLVNFADVKECKRCGAFLVVGQPYAYAPSVNPPADAEGDKKPKPALKKILLKSALRIFSLVAFILFIGYATLLSTSEPVVLEQKQVVNRAIDVVEQKGFGKEAFILRNLVFYRATDNWWNRKVGHASAYAATNFPFEVVTLYPPFFEHATDDTERAVILLHEAYHLMGYGEETAYETVWRNKRQLGWTKESYYHTIVWNGVKAETEQYAPHLFRCGKDGKSDCVE